MPEQQPDYAIALLSEFNTKLVDIEEKQKIMKDRILLVGENLVKAREEIFNELTKLKISSDEMKQDILKIKETFQRIIEELENRARKSELDILKRQFSMFQPLEFARMEDLKKILEKKKGG